jgi:hypothetical protein
MDVKALREMIAARRRERATYAVPNFFAFNACGPFTDRELQSTSSTVEEDLPYHELERSLL